MVFFICLLVLGVILMLFFIYQSLSEINDNILDFNKDFYHNVFISFKHNRKGKK